MFSYSIWSPSGKHEPTDLKEFKNFYPVYNFAYPFIFAGDFPDSFNNDFDIKMINTIVYENNIELVEVNYPLRLNSITGGKTIRSCHRDDDPLVVEDPDT